MWGEPWTNTGRRRSGCIGALDPQIDALANDVSENHRAFTTGHENIMRFSCLGRPTAEID
jgi:hypothetical protein